MELKKKFAADKFNENELRNIFMNCVEQTRREIYKRRIKAIQNPLRKGNNDIDQDLSRIEILSKLSEFNDNRVLFKNFTAVDKSKVLSIFVENEYVIEKMCDIMFSSINIKNNKEETKNEHLSLQEDNINIMFPKIKDSIETPSKGRVFLNNRHFTFNKSHDGNNIVNS